MKHQKMLKTKNMGHNNAMALFNAAEALHTSNRSNRSERNSIQFGDSNLLDDQDLEDFSKDQQAIQCIQTPIDSSRNSSPVKPESEKKG